MLCQAFIQKCVVCSQKIEHAAIFAQNTLEKKLGFLPEGLPQIIIEVGKKAQVRSDRFEIAQVEPLLSKIAGQRSRTGIDQHAPHLLAEHLWLAEIAPNGGVEQFVVRNAAPE